jgi:guanosine-3',5'-bis(diphosphate) 3'-pyrophosphohydrolase
MESELIIDARQFAAKKHAGQMYGDKPYTYHLEEVYKVARRYELHVFICVAALLHDILEDTNVSPIELRTFFGYDVAGLVEDVTDEPGENRKERAEKTWPKIRNSKAAVALKLCDRIANVKACHDGIGNVKLLEMYRKEHEAFKKALYYKSDEDELQAMWDELDSLIGKA